MKTARTLLVSAIALAAAVSLPAAAQVDLSRIAWVGDSEGAGFSANCLTKRVQVDSPGAVMARANGADYQQPIMGDPGLGGCLVLTSLAPSFGKEPSVVKPENLGLTRPYNNLSVGGCAIHDMLYATTGAETVAAGTCRNTIDLVLRNATFHWGSMIDQANLLNPTFTVLENVGNDYLGAVLSGTVIDGVTVTPVAQYTADINAAVAKLKSKQANGLVFGVADVTSIPFATTLPPFLTSGGKLVLNPATGAPIPLLGPKGCPTGVPACPIPANTLVTLNAAAYLPAGYGIPCAVAPTLPKCNNPLPDSVDAAGNPGVLLYADEVALLKQRYADYNAATKAAAAANGYKFYDTNDFLLRMKAGFDFGGTTLSAAFLTGGLFSYDGFHLTPIGYALLADDLIKFINASFPNTNLKEPDLSVYIYQGGTAGGLAGSTVSFAWAPITDAEKATAIEQIFTPEFARDLAAMYSAHRATVTAGPAAPAQRLERAPRLDPMP
jgi:lysophospholipase L1-like esterase